MSYLLSDFDRTLAARTVQAVLAEIEDAGADTYSADPSQDVGFWEQELMWTVNPFLANKLANERSRLTAVAKEAMAGFNRVQNAETAHGIVTVGYANRVWLADKLAEAEVAKMGEGFTGGSTQWTIRVSFSKERFADMEALRDWLWEQPGCPGWISIEQF